MQRVKIGVALVLRFLLLLSAIPAVLAEDATEATTTTLRIEAENYAAALSTTDAKSDYTNADGTVTTL